MLENIKKFVVDNKDNIVRGAIILGGSLVGLVAAAIAVQSNKEELVQPTLESEPVKENPTTEDPTV